MRPTVVTAEKDRERHVTTCLLAARVFVRKALLFRPVSGFRAILPTRMDLDSQGQPGTAGDSRGQPGHRLPRQRHPRSGCACFQSFAQMLYGGSMGATPDPTALCDRDQSLQPLPGSRPQVTLQRSPPAPPTCLGRSRPGSRAQTSRRLLPADSPRGTLSLTSPQGVLLGH